MTISKATVAGSVFKRTNFKNCPKPRMITVFKDTYICNLPSGRWQEGNELVEYSTSITEVSRNSEEGQTLVLVQGKLYKRLDDYEFNGERLTHWLVVINDAEKSLGKENIDVFRVPSTATTCSAAVNYILPAKVKRAREKGLTTFRIGGFYFVQTKRRTTKELPDGCEIKNNLVRVGEEVVSFEDGLQFTAIKVNCLA